MWSTDDRSHSKSTDMFSGHKKSRSLQPHACFMSCLKAPQPTDVIHPSLLQAVLPSRVLGEREGHRFRESLWSLGASSRNLGPHSFALLSIRVY